MKDEDEGPTPAPAPLVLVPDTLGWCMGFLYVLPGSKGVWQSCKFEFNEELESVWQGRDAGQPVVPSRRILAGLAALMGRMLWPSDPASWVTFGKLLNTPRLGLVHCLTLCAKDSEPRFRV